MKAVVYRGDIQSRWQQYTGIYNKNILENIAMSYWKIQKMLYWKYSNVILENTENVILENTAMLYWKIQKMLYWKIQQCYTGNTAMLYWKLQQSYTIHKSLIYSTHIPYTGQQYTEVYRNVILYIYIGT